MTSCEAQPKHTQEEKKHQILTPYQRHLQVVMMLPSLTPNAKKKIKLNVANRLDHEINEAFC